MKTFYSDDFEELWRAYAAPANASKKTAYEAYKKAKDIPAHPLLMQCVAAYNEFLRANSTPGRDYPKAHLATWLNQERWDGFLDRAEELLRAENGHREAKEAAVFSTAASWPTTVLNRLNLPPKTIETWILPCQLIALENPIRIVAPTKFYRNWILEKFGDKLRSVLGDDVVVTTDATKR